MTELLPLIWESVAGQKLRSALTILGIVIGIASVVLLSSVGEGTRRGIAGQFTQFGTTLMGVMPGKSETFGAPGSMLGTTRPLTLDDLRAVRRIHGVRRAGASVAGAAEVEHGSRGRSVYVYGVLHEGQEIWKWRARVGQFIPEGDPEQVPPVCVLGPKLAEELFGASSPLGETVQVGGAKFRVVGVMEPKGQLLGMDLDDAAYLPLVRAMRLFNLDELHEIQVDAASHDEIERVEAEVRRVLTARHGGEEDFTIMTQTAMLEVIDNVLGIITKGVIAIAAIAIFVGAMGILTITWVSVHERTSEIGVMKAVGASRGQVLSIFLSEAVALSTLGGLAGVAFGVLGARGLGAAGIPAELAPGVVPICLGVSMLVGALAGWAPARRASNLDPVQALREE